jgi:hypothetical protein
MANNCHFALSKISVIQIQTPSNVSPSK